MEGSGAQPGGGAEAEQHGLQPPGVEALRVPARRRHRGPSLGVGRHLPSPDALRHPLPARLAPGRAWWCWRTTASALGTFLWMMAPASPRSRSRRRRPRGSHGEKACM